MAEACYQEPYLPASYKGVSFTAVEVTSEHGRRGAEGEFPFGEVTGYADLGRRIRTYSLQGEFRGNNHVLQAALLIAAVEIPGPGPLIHPTRGVIIAACKSLRVRDSIEENGGVTYVDLEFVEANIWPNGLSLVGQVLGLVLGSLISTSRAAFTSNYAPTEIQSFREEAVINAAQVQVANVAAQYATVTTDQLTNDDRNRVLYDFSLMTASLEQARQTDLVDRALSLGMAAVSNNAPDAETKYTAFRSLANGAAKVSTFREPAESSENAIYSHVRTLAAAYMAEAAIDSEDNRTGEIYAQADAIDAILEQEMAYAYSTCQNTLYDELAKFRTEVATQLYNKAHNAPGLVEYDFSGRLSPLTAAYDIFGDAKKHRQLEGLNTVGSYGRIGPSVTAVGG